MHRASFPSLSLSSSAMFLGHFYAEKRTSGSFYVTCTTPIYVPTYMYPNRRTYTSTDVGYVRNCTGKVICITPDISIETPPVQSYAIIRSRL
jgi:hypothetical protein